MLERRAGDLEITALQRTNGGNEVSVGQCRRQSLKLDCSLLGLGERTVLERLTGSPMPIGDSRVVELWGGPSDGVGAYSPIE